MKVAGSYYNEIDPYAAQWLRNLIAAGHIAPGDVDTRSIIDVRPDDLAGYTQCHFFAGIGGWSLAARLAGWPDDRPLWTGSCPCQPFSVAGKGEGQEDERHLWPIFFDLIRACRPDVVMGEQVAAAVGKHWLDGVHSDLESIGYACGATVVPACAVDAPHRRDRLWFVADADGLRWRARTRGDVVGEPSLFAQHGSGQRKDAQRNGDQSCERETYDPSRNVANGNRVASRQGHPVAGGSEDGTSARQVSRSVGASEGSLADANLLSQSEGREQRSGQLGGAGGDTQPCGRDVGHASGEGLAVGSRAADQRGTVRGQGTTASQADHRSAWGAASWLAGADGKARRVEPSIRLLAHGVPARVGKLRAYGNAIVPAVAAEVIGAFMDVRP